MSLTFYPKNNSERDQALYSVTSAVAQADADPTLVMLDGALFSDARATYVAARQDWEEATARRRYAEVAAATADTTFDQDLRTFTLSVRDATGRPQPRVVSELLGGMLPSKLSRRGLAEEVRRATILLNRLPERLDLSYDAASSDALRASTDALATAVRAYNDACNAQTAAGHSLTEARTSFDRSYRKLLAAARGALPEVTVLSTFPRFNRSAPGDAAESAPSEVVIA